MVVCPYCQSKFKRMSKSCCPNCGIKLRKAGNILISENDYSKLPELVNILESNISRLNNVKFSFSFKRDLMLEYSIIFSLIDSSRSFIQSQGSNYDAFDFLKFATLVFFEHSNFNFCKHNTVSFGVIKSMWKKLSLISYQLYVKKKQSEMIQVKREETISTQTGGFFGI